MIELFALLVLAGINVALLAGHILYVRASNEEKAKLLNAVLSKTPEQYRDLEMVNKIEPIKAEVPAVPDLVSPEEMTDEEWAKNMLGEPNGRS